MLLFLDVISPLPEFLVIEDNKVILHRKIIDNESDKLSDNIFQAFIGLNKGLNLIQNLEKIVITIGPGSYTSLRVGAAFVSGLHILKDIHLCSFSISDIINFKLNINNKNNSGFYLESANEQKFFCYLEKNNKIMYSKIENGSFIIPNQIDTIFYNISKLNLEIKNIKQYKFSFAEELLKNHSKLNFQKNEILKPIYISNNKVLN